MERSELIEQYKEGKRDFKNAYLEGADLSGTDLKEANLTGAHLKEASLWRADLRGADLRGAHLREAHLSDANLEGVNLRGAILIEANLEGTNLEGADWSNAELREANLERANLRGAYLRGLDLRGVHLRGANLEGANLRGAYLREADLSYSNLEGANLRGANLEGANLRGAYLRGLDLRGVNLREFDLSYSNLEGADLEGADLSQAKLWKADLSQTNLKNVDLSQVIGLETKFENATLTGAIIEDWNINSQTNFEGVICDYIYFKEGQQERSPASGNFAPGEFAKLVEKLEETVDLIFADGIDWKAFFCSLKDLQDRYGKENVSIQGFERKRNQAFVIHLDVASNVDKKVIYSQAKQFYETKFQQLKAVYRSKLKAKDKEIEIYHQQSTNLWDIVRREASRPIDVKAIAMADKHEKNVEVEMNISGGTQKNVVGKVAGNMNVYASEQKQTLAEAAAEIQKLLKQLELTNPTATEIEKVAYINDETSPGFKRRVVGALKAGGETAIEEFLDNPYVNVGKAVVKGWMNPE